ncbi:MAG: carboxypeptidase regulatory-like domain-containing protein, partial [Planctomycetaceae bacterium]
MTELCYGPAISIRFFIAMAALLTPAVVAQDEGFVWEGLVVDEKWQPLVEATVRAKWMREIPGEEPKLVHGSRVRTNENGQYQITVPQKLRGLEAIVLHVRVSKAGYLTRNAKPIAVDSLFQNGKQEVAPEARAARRELTRMQVRRGRVIKGHVRLANGNPAVGAEVVVSTKPGEYDWKFPDPNRYYATGIAITDGDGNYELIGDLRASMRVQLSGHAEYSIALLPEGRADNPTPLTHNVRFPTGIRPSGTIVDSRGRPVANAIIRFVSAAPQNTGG